jgi:hypothetical protein
MNMVWRLNQQCAGPPVLRGVSDRLFLCTPSLWLTVRTVGSLPHAFKCDIKPRSPRAAQLIRTNSESDI